MLSDRCRPTVLALCALVLLGGVSSPRESQGQAGAGGRDKVLQVGPGREYRTPSAAAAVARNGDVIEIDSGTYAGDVAVWRAHRLTLRGVGGRAHLRADGNHAEGKAIWVIKGNNVTVESIEFSGARVPDGNGAGIRQEGRNLTVRDCHFHDNQMGILAGDNPGSRILVEHSIFADSASDSALAHNIYVNHVRRFIFRYNYTHGATSGHNLKSRAKRTDILYNRIGDEDGGRSSYGIDLANGGKAFVIGNVIQQGPKSENSTIVAYGAEGFTSRRNVLFFVHNTVVNDRPSGSFLRVWDEPRRAKILNNLFVGPGSMDEGRGWRMGGNLFRSTDPGFIDAEEYDYRLRAGSSAVDAGVRVAPPRLRPRFHYVHTAERERRRSSGKPDVGAYER